MATRTYLANKSSLFATAGSSLGGGADDHLPVGGPWNGYTFRSAVQFGLGFTDVTRIVSATLRLYTSSQVHVGFSSAPDIYVRRATASWSANSSSSSAEGGSGWGTSPTVYPGPASTTTGQGSKRVTTAEGAAVDIDVTAIVRAWAPSSAVEGGGDAPNYGIVLLAAASSDITEFNSYRNASGKPYITLVYESDAPPPAPTITAPAAGSTGTSLKPTLSATAVDPDGDPLEVGDVEVRKAAAVVYSSTAVPATGASTLSHTPTSNLPSGDLEVRWRARANGVYGAWSAYSPFVIDRTAVVGAWSAPPATVNGTRRPPLTFAWSDADADAGQAYDLEVYASDAGAPVGSAVYKKTGQSAGLGASSVTHTPTADLPGGPLLARARVKSRNVYGAWSAYHPFNVVILTSTIVWSIPAEPGGGLVYRGSHMDDLALPVGSHQHRADFTVTPPAGKTITQVSYTITQLDPASVVIASGNATAPAAGGPVSIYGTVQAAHASNATRWRVDLTVTDSGGGIATASRVGMVAYGEWYGSVALGDNADALAIVETILSPVTAASNVARLWYRAQSSPSAAAGSASWQKRADVATVEAGLPATNAYLGVRVRAARFAAPPQLLVNPSYEDPADPNNTDGSALVGWTRSNASGTIGAYVHTSATDGGRVCRVTSTGAGITIGALSPVIPAVPGQTYRASCWVGRGNVARAGRIRISSYLGAVQVVAAAAQTDRTPASSTMEYLEAFFTVPTDGTVDGLRIAAMIVSGAIGDYISFDEVYLHGADIPAVEGVDKLAISWTSLG